MSAYGLQLQIALQIAGHLVHIVTARHLRRVAKRTLIPASLGHGRRLAKLSSLFALL